MPNSYASATARLTCGCSPHRSAPPEALWPRGNCGSPRNAPASVSLHLCGLNSGLKLSRNQPSQIANPYLVLEPNSFFSIRARATLRPDRQSLHRRAAMLGLAAPLRPPAWLGLDSPSTAVLGWRGLEGPPSRQLQSGAFRSFFTSLLTMRPEQPHNQGRAQTEVACGHDPPYRELQRRTAVERPNKLTMEDAEDD